MKAISIRQPWAWLIVHGYKDIENRSRNYGFQGRILVHTGKNPDRRINEIREEVKKKYGIEIPYYLPLGGVVGEVEITETVIESKSPWFTGPYGLVLQKPKPLKLYRCRGQLGIFTI